MYLKGSIGVEIATVLEKKWGGLGCGHEMDLKRLQLEQELIV